jgi:hypothetical protein
VTGTPNQIDVATGTTTPVISLDPQFTVNSYGTCTNTADVVTLTPADAPTALANGLTVACKFSAANTTTTPTLNVNSLGAKTIVKAGTSGQAALVANDILTNMVATFKYNAATTTWELQNPQQLAATYRWRSCQGGLGDGVNAITAATYPFLACVNNSGATMTVTAIHFYCDAGASTLDVKNNAGTSLLTGAVTCSTTKTSGGAAGTQSGTTTIATTDGFNVSIVADGTSKTVSYTVDVTLP